MNWLLPSIIANLVGTIVLSVTYFYLYSSDRQKFMLVWAVSWLFYASRYLFLLLGMGEFSYVNKDILLMGNQLCALGSGYLLLWGIHLFIKKGLPRLWMLFLFIGVCWIIATILSGQTFLVITAPTFLFLGVVYIWNGLVIRSRYTIAGMAKNLTAMAFILWGMHKMNYPLLATSQWFAPWGYFLGAMLEIIVAIGILMIYFQAIREDLEKSEERFDLALQGSSDGIWDWEDILGGRPWWSPRIYEMLGYTPGEIEPSTATWKRQMHPDDRQRVMETFQQHLEKKIPYDIEYRLRTKEGNYRWFRSRGRAVYNRESDRIRMSGTLQDITELKTAHFQLQMAKFSIDKTRLGIFWTSEDTGFIYVNEFACQTLGYSRAELLTMTVFDIDTDLTGDMWEKHWRKLREKGSEIVQSSHRKKDGTIFPVEIVTNFLVYNGREYIFAYAMDISERQQSMAERQRLEEQIRRSQKMEALGTLAGGIAHDFNNLLGVILGYTDIAREDAPADSSMAEDLDKVLTAGYRARDLIHQILAFSRQSQVQRIPIRPQPIIKEVLKLLRSTIPATIAIEENITAETVIIDADVTQFHQIMMNLCANAFQAMEKSGGTLTVELSAIGFLTDEMKKEVSEPDRPHIMLSVQDTGCGISPVIIDKIFDPFYTTKERGKGTGMGLAIVYGIVREYGGTIRAESRLGRGSTFCIYIPQSLNNIDPDTGRDTPAAASGREHILFVDDEELLAELGREMLERLGYRVTTHKDSLAALECFRNNPEGFDLVITDQTMPGLTGIDLSRRILRIRPDMPIILCTGYSTMIDEKTAKLQGIREFALKPLTRDMIAGLIRTVLDQRQE